MKNRPRSESGLAKGTRERPLPRIVQIPVSSRVTMEFTGFHFLRIKNLENRPESMRDFRVSRERVSIAVTKLRSNRRQTRPLTNLRATINNVKANSRIERRSRTPSVAYQKERVFSLSSPRRSDECSHAMRLGARERGWLPPHTPPHTTSLERDFPRQRKETAGISSPREAISSSKSRTRMRPSPGSRVSRTRATRRLFSTLPLSRSIFSYR